MVIEASDKLLFVTVTAKFGRCSDAPKRYVTQPLIFCFCANLHSRKREELELASYCFLLLLLPSHTGEMLQRGRF